MSRTQRRRPASLPSFSQTSWRLSAAVAGGLTLAALALVFLFPPDLFLGASYTDMMFGNAASRAYLANSLLAGHLPLWDPYTYGGEPFLGGFEAGVLYPPNLLFLVLPLARAINFSILLHLIFLGWGMERWASQRRLTSGSAALAGLVVMLSGSVYPHIYAGHLDGLCTLAWAPWIFLGFEMYFRQARCAGLFLASAAAALQIFAGHIQYFFYTAVAVGLYATMLSLLEPATRRRALPAVAGCYLAAAALGAAQLLPGLSAAAEGVRQQKLDFHFASMFGFAPENFLTLTTPEFFGSLSHGIYWGRCYFWEMSLFIGAASPLLMAAALCHRQRRHQALLDLAMFGMLFVLALGFHTPLFKLLYDFAPGFGHFRGISKFIFPATLFLALIIGSGADLLLRGEKVARAVAWLGLGAGSFFFLAGFYFTVSPEGIAAFLRFIAASHESYLPPEDFTHPDLIYQAGRHAGLSLDLTGMVLGLAGMAFLFLEKGPLVRWVVPGLVVLELVGFDWKETETSPFSAAMPDELRQFVAARPGDYRVLDLSHPNNGFLLGVGDASGNTPSVRKRYAEFVAFSQGGDPNHVDQYLSFRRLDPLDALIRLRFVFFTNEKGNQVAESLTPPLPQLLLVSEWKTPGNRDAIFSAMRDPSFDPRRTVMLEQAPDPKPEAGATGSVKMISALPDELTIEAETDKPALLLITDPYARDWKAETLPGSVQKTYTLSPADYVLRAVPLSAGHHHLRVVYAPSALPMGMSVSVLAWALGIVLFVRWRRS